MQRIELQGSQEKLKHIGLYDRGKTQKRGVA